MTETVDKPPEKKNESRSAAARINTLFMPVLATFTGLLAGAVIIAVTNPAALNAWSHFFAAPGQALLATWSAVSTAYGALFVGSIGSPREIVSAFPNSFATAQAGPVYAAINPFTESPVTATPYIFAGLAVAVGFRCGLFNIGAEGQFYLGALGSAFIGYKLVGWPWYIHLPLALLGGAFAGAVWGAIPGYLKARFGAHEVVNTIMMNWIAFRLTDWLLTGPMQAPGYRPVTPTIEKSAELPRFFPDPLRLNWGFLLALAIAAVVYWFLFKTTLGFEIRAVGANPDAAKYAGMNIVRNFVLVMTLSGALAGLAGAAQVLRTDPWI